MGSNSHGRPLLGRVLVLGAYLVASGLGISCDDGGDSGACQDPSVPADNGCAILRCSVVPEGGDTGGDTYTTFAQGFFSGYCNRCHAVSRTDDSFSCAASDPTCRRGAPLGHDWDDPASIRAHLDHVRFMVGEANAMPPDGTQPTCEERFRLVRWIDAGAPGLP